MKLAYHLSGGAPLLKRIKIGASFANAGIVTINGTAGVIPSTTTDFADTMGLALDTATYSSSQGASHAEGLVTVDVRPDAVIRALMSGGATENTQLTQLVNTSASTDGLTVTDADVGSADMVSGTVWCTKGANVGQSRAIATHNASQDFVVTVPFINDIAVGDEFLFCPYNEAGLTDGAGNVQTSTLFTQADASIASGTGGLATVVALELNGRGDSYVLMQLGDHVFVISTI